MTKRCCVLLALLLFAAAIQPACTVINSAYPPLVFPPSARLGDTVGMSIDTNAFALGNAPERYNLSNDNVTIEVQDPAAGNAVVQTLDPRAVFEAGPSEAAKFDEGGGYIVPGARVTIVLIDLPDPLDQSFSFPKTLNLQLLVGGVPAQSVVGTVTVTGSGGTPTAFAPISDPLAMQPKPMVRLVGVHDATGQQGFTGTSTPVGGIEFTLVYDESKIIGPEAFPASSATGATAIPSMRELFTSKAFGPRASTARC